jgi:hypothetical protein
MKKLSPFLKIFISVLMLAIIDGIILYFSLALNNIIDSKTILIVLEYLLGAVIGLIILLMLIGGSFCLIDVIKDNIKLLKNK